jgi:hypothetical protein
VLPGPASPHPVQPGTPTLADPVHPGTPEAKPDLPSRNVPRSPPAPPPGKPPGSPSVLLCPAAIAGTPALPGSGPPAGKPPGSDSGPIGPKSVIPGSPLGPPSGKAHGVLPGPPFSVPAEHSKWAYRKLAKTDVLSAKNLGLLAGPSSAPKPLPAPGPVWPVPEYMLADIDDDSPLRPFKPKLSIPKTPALPGSGPPAGKASGAPPGSNSGPIGPGPASGKAHGVPPGPPFSAPARHSKWADRKLAKTDVLLGLPIPKSLGLLPGPSSAPKPLPAPCPVWPVPEYMLHHIDDDSPLRPPKTPTSKPLCKPAGMPHPVRAYFSKHQPSFVPAPSPAPLAPPLAATSSDTPATLPTATSADTPTLILPPAADSPEEDPRADSLDGGAIADQG